MDVPESCYWLSNFLKRWGYEPIESHLISIDSVLELIAHGKFDLLVIAKDLTIRGPSRSDDWKEGDEIRIAFSFGMETLSRLRVKSKLPVVVVTNDPKRKDLWTRNDQGRLDWVILTRCESDEGSFLDKLRRALEEFWGGRVATHGTR